MPGGGEVERASQVAMTVAGLCRNFNCLPRAGGLLDQDPYWIAVFGIVVSAEADKSALDNANLEKETNALRSP